MRWGEHVGPDIDDEVRARLSRRYGSGVAAWLDAVPELLEELAERWQLHLGSLVRRGTVSLVLRCRDQSGTPVVLKVSPDRERIANESRTLAAWLTPHVPQVIDSDTPRGAVLLEAIQPGTALDESGRVPDISAVANLLEALHEHAPSLTSVASVHERIAALYRSGAANYSRRPDLEDLIPRSLYTRGQRAAETLAAETRRRVVLHGDLTPANVLDGGSARGLVAVDPAPCLGDPEFDAVDLLLWGMDDVYTLSRRARDLDALLGFPEGRALRWCSAFAAMAALEVAEASPQGTATPARLKMLLKLASVA
jgi:streptomycin 6-kinase